MVIDEHGRRESAVEEHESPPAPEEGGHEDPIDEYSKRAQQELVKRQSSDAQKRPSLQHAVSASSIAVSVIKVPRRNRTGLLASWCLLYEAEEPKNYPRNVKWLITLWIALAAITAPMGSSIILRAYTSYVNPVI